MLNIDKSSVHVHDFVSYVVKQEIEDRNKKMRMQMKTRMKEKKVNALYIWCGIMNIKN